MSNSPYGELATLATDHHWKHMEGLDPEYTGKEGPGGAPRTEMGGFMLGSGRVGWGTTVIPDSTDE